MAEPRREDNVFIVDILRINKYIEINPDAGVPVSDVNKAIIFVDPDTKQIRITENGDANKDLHTGSEGGGGLENPLTEDLDCDGNKIVGLDTPTDDQDAVNLITLNSAITSLTDYVDTIFLRIDGSVAMVNSLDIGGNSIVNIASIVFAGGAITGLADPLDPQDAATKAYVDSNFRDNKSPATGTISIDVTKPITIQPLQDGDATINFNTTGSHSGDKVYFSMETVDDNRTITWNTNVYSDGPTVVSASCKAVIECVVMFDGLFVLNVVIIGY